MFAMRQKPGRLGRLASKLHHRPAPAEIVDVHVSGALLFSIV